MHPVRYKIKITSAAAAYSIRVNDVLLSEDSTYTSVYTSFYINEWLIDGPNIISLNVEGKDGAFDFATYAEMEVGYTGMEDIEFTSLYSIELEDLHQKSPNLPVVYILNVEKMPERLQLNQLPMIMGDRTLLESIFHANRNLQQLFEVKSKDEIVTACAHRMEVYDKLYLKPMGHSQKVMEELLDTVFSSEEMLNYMEQYLVPVFHAGGKVVSLKYSKYPDLTPISSSPPDYSSTRTFYFYWAIDENGRPFIYR